MRVFLIGILLALIGIGVDGVYQYVSANQVLQREEQKDLSNKKALIIYFSLSDNTKDVAYQIKRFPTWWHQPPRIIHIFFRDYDVKGKVIVPFTTSMSESIQ